MASQLLDCHHCSSLRLGFARNEPGFFLFMSSFRRSLSLLFVAPLAATAVLAGERPAKAILTYYIFESGPNVVVETRGSISLGAPIVGPYITLSCGQGNVASGAIISSSALICTGPTQVYDNFYAIVSGPDTFNGNVNAAASSSVSGISTYFEGDFAYFGIDPSYVSGSPVVSSATFNNTTLAGLGFTTTGVIGTWELFGTGDTITAVIGAPPATADVPGPLPLFGAAAAFAHSRRLRRRVNQGRIASRSANGTSA